MRTLIDLGEPEVKALDDLAKKTPPSPLDEAFGLWGDRTVDGLDYQRRMRDEW